MEEAIHRRGAGDRRKRWETQSLDRICRIPKTAYVNRNSGTNTDLVGIGNKIDRSKLLPRPR